ncbi:hypothetical protein PROFUN_01453 [Planoprotostelium fungivorum]|uniref:non-specific serine/threonine protein kinase n=1 Tax=Planoprotostelium fungivorum TaxID=1890364 RepID=A0A2P6NTC2_9EUKA|nr:hypothetical protein PROFUN_01453 [Planoprotostelium fungivorum]
MDATSQRNAPPRGATREGLDPATSQRMALAPTSDPFFAFGRQLPPPPPAHMAGIATPSFTYDMHRHPPTILQRFGPEAFGLRMVPPPPLGYAYPYPYPDQMNPNFYRGVNYPMANPHGADLRDLYNTAQTLLSADKEVREKSSTQNAPAKLNVKTPSNAPRVMAPSSTSSPSSTPTSTSESNQASTNHKKRKSVEKRKRSISQRKSVDLANSSPSQPQLQPPAQPTSSPLPPSVPSASPLPSPPSTPIYVPSTSENLKGVRPGITKDNQVRRDYGDRTLAWEALRERTAAAADRAAALREREEIRIERQRLLNLRRRLANGEYVTPAQLRPPIIRLSRFRPQKKVVVDLSVNGPKDLPTDVPSTERLVTLLDPIGCLSGQDSDTLTIAQINGMSSPNMEKKESVGQPTLYLKLTVPSFRELGSKTKKFTPNETVKDVIDLYNKKLPPLHQSLEYNLYYNGTRLVRESLLIDNNLGRMETVEMKREPQYEIIMTPDCSDPTKANILEEWTNNQLGNTNIKNYLSLKLDWDVKTSDAIKFIGRWVCSARAKAIKKKSVEQTWAKGEISPRSPPKNPVHETPLAYNESSFHLYKVVNGRVQQELGDLKDLCANDIKNRDTLSFEAKIQSSGEVEKTQLIIVHSPAEEYRAWFDGKRAAYTQQVQADPLRDSSGGGLGKWLGMRRGVQEVADGVSRPYNVVHKAHVDFNFQWSGQKPELIFEWISKIGQGAYGAVWVARHRETNFQLAVKVVPANEAGKATIAKEVEVLKQCKSPNVLSYFGTCITALEVWILMDFCAVGSVKDMINRTLEPLEEHQIAYVNVGALKGLVYLHSQNIIHLDVKAANIMVNENCEVKLGDFGVSEQMMASASDRPIDLVGSPLYMPPEVILKSGYNSKADIWSLGITLIEMAEGRPPNNDIRSLEQLKQLPNRPPATLKHSSAFSKNFNDFIARCLVKDPTQRPDTIELLMHPFVQTAGGAETIRGLVKTCLDMAASEQTSQ